MNYNINLGGWNRIFAVPSDVVDKYIKIAYPKNQNGKRQGDAI